MLFSVPPTHQNRTKLGWKKSLLCTLSVKLLPNAYIWINTLGVIAWWLTLRTGWFELSKVALTLILFIQKHLIENAKAISFAILRRRSQVFVSDNTFSLLRYPFGKILYVFMHGLYSNLNVISNLQFIEHKRVCFVFLISKQIYLIFNYKPKLRNLFNM